MFIGSRLRSRREALGLTLEQVGEYLGVNKATVQRYESENIDIKRTVALKLSEVLNVTPGYVMGWEDESQQNDNKLLHEFHELNQEGQEKVIQYAEDLNESGRYKKFNQYEMVKEKV